MHPCYMMVLKRSALGNYGSLDILDGACTSLSAQKVRDPPAMYTYQRRASTR